MGRLFEGTLDGGGRRKGSAPEGEAWFVDGLVVNGTRAILSIVYEYDDQPCVSERPKVKRSLVTGRVVKATVRTCHFKHEGL